MPPKAPDGMRWCKACQKFMSITQFGKYLSAYCHPHWLEWNRTKARQYHKDHPGYNGARAKRRALEHPEKIRESNQKTIARQKALGWPNLKKWIAENPDKARECWRKTSKAWRDANPDKAAATRHRKRARRSKAPGFHTGADLTLLRNRFHGKCIYCGADATTWDHIRPMYRGGSNFAWNLAPSCLTCNSRKQDRDPITFITKQKMDPEARRYIEESVKLGQELGAPEQYIRNQYEKVPEASLWNELRPIYQRLGRVTSVDLQQTRFSASTYRRRLGCLRIMNRTLAEE